MSALSTSLITTSTTLIAKLGRAASATFTRLTATTYSTSTLAQSSSSGTYTVAVAVADFTLKEISLNNTLIGQKKLYVAGGTSYTPAIADTVVLGTTTFRVLDITTYETGSVNCAYMLRIGV